MKHSVAAIFLSYLAFSALSAIESPVLTRPNILFIAIDDLRPELGCYGKSYIHSPNIDELARSGMVFDRAYVSQAVCSPSRTAVLTGVRPDTSRVWDLKTNFRDTIPKVVTLGQCFIQNGYFVQGMGKIYHGKFNDDAASWSVPWQTFDGPLYVQEGYAEVKGGEADSDDKNGADAKSYSVPGETKKKGGDRKGPIFECLDVPDNAYLDGQIADLAVKTLADLPKKKPFFLAVGFVRPHLPFVAPRKYWDHYDESKIDLAPNQFRAKDSPAYAIVGNGIGELHSYRGLPKDDHLPDEVQRKLKHGYFACVSYIDAQVGKVLDALRHQGLDKNTVVVLWGDHGWKLGEHDAWAKHTNVEDDVNAPLVVSVPGMQAAGTHSKALVEFVDIYPTLCDLAGIPKPGHLEGASFSRLIANPDQPWKSAAFSQYPRHDDTINVMGYTMRTDQYRLTVWVQQNDRDKIADIELYDHDTDPQENINIAKNPENAAELKKLMAQWKLGWRGSLPPTP